MGTAGREGTGWHRGTGFPQLYDYVTTYNQYSKVLQSWVAPILQRMDGEENLECQNLRIRGLPSLLTAG